MNKTEAAWQRLSQHLSLEARLASGELVVVSAQEIQAVTNREPRLMMKFDERAQRPLPIKTASILPVSNGEYLIVPGDAYHSVEPSEVTYAWPLSTGAQKLETLPWSSGPRSESQLLDMLIAAGLLDSFLNEEHQALTIRGRLRSPAFDLDFETPYGLRNVRVDGVQVEVDAGLEGENIHLLEAKMGKRTDFHMRQLYYPVRMWRELLPHRCVRALFISYSDRIASLRLYEFQPVSHFQGLSLLKSADYTFEPDSERLDLQYILNNTVLGAPPAGVPFPQADDIHKVLDLVDAVGSEVTETDAIVDRYGFTERQVAYYANAARYLGLLSLTSTPELTRSGLEFCEAGRSRRHNIVVQALATLPIFRSIFEAIVSGEGMPTNEQIEQAIEEVAQTSGVPIGGSTLVRRRSTVVAWVRWVRTISEPS